MSVSQNQLSSSLCLLLRSDTSPALLSIVSPDHHLSLSLILHLLLRYCLPPVVPPPPIPPLPYVGYFLPKTDSTSRLATGAWLNGGKAVQGGNRAAMAMARAGHQLQYNWAARRHGMLNYLAGGFSELDAMIKHASRIAAS